MAQSRDGPVGCPIIERADEGLPAVRADRRSVDVSGLILVTGGTGTLGQHVVRVLAADGHHVRVLSRRPRPAGQGQPGQGQPGRGQSGHGQSDRGHIDWATGDLRKGRGIGAAVAGASAIVHCATGLGKSDVQATSNLIEEARLERPHLVFISIVGIDRVPVGYYKSKLEAERLVEASALPWTILRATQFHQLILRGCDALAHLPVLPVPAGTSFQPVEAAEVAGRLATLAVDGAAGRVPDMGGPEVRGADDLARAYLKARGRRRPVLPVLLPGPAFAGLRRGALLTPDHAVGRVTFGQFLAERFAASG
jgi:uncharacterized protein YbjT (DUF2867 family)